MWESLLRRERELLGVTCAYFSEELACASGKGGFVLIDIPGVLSCVNFKVWEC